MNRAIGATILALSILLPPAAGAQQTNSNAAVSQAPNQLTGRQKEELQARVLMARKEYPEAVKAYVRLSKEDPHNPTYLNFVGLALLQLSDVTNAERYFQRATKANKRFAEGYNNLGAVEFSRKRYGSAIRQYRKALAIDPQVASYWGNLVYAYFAQKKYPQAMDAFQKAVSLDPATFETSDRNGNVMQYRAVTEHGLFDFMLAKSYAQSGDAARCAVYLRKALDEGYKNIASARSDPAFAKVRTSPDVKMVMDELPQPASTPPAAHAPGA